jgi:hypothetical protein
MMIALVVLGFGFLGLITLFVVALRRLFKASEVPVTVEWAKSFSLSAYAPMERLLDDGDFRFLKTQPGYNRKIANELRAKRVRIFQAYLGMMSRDFHRLHATLQSYLLSLDVDDPQISAELVRQKWNFHRALLIAHLQLKLYSLGLGTVSAAPLIAAMGTMGQLVGDVPELLSASVSKQP